MSDVVRARGALVPRTLPRASVRHRRPAAGTCALTILFLGSLAAAHTLSADDVIAEIGGPAGREIGVASVARAARVPRVLVVKMGRRWAEVPAARRVEAVEGWLAHWREAVAQGVLGVIDEATGATLVNFDARGRARLTTLPTERPASPALP